MPSSDPHVIAVASLREFFHNAMQQALPKCRVTVGDHTEHYVVNMLVMYSRTDSVFEQGSQDRGLPALAHLLAEAREAPTAHLHDLLLQRLGDLALFTAGFFSEAFERSLVDIDYHMAMGALAYGELASRARDTVHGRALGNVFLELAENFQPLVDVLNEIAEASKSYTAGDVLRLYEVYLKTGSLRALTILKSLGIDPVAGSTRAQC